MKHTFTMLTTLALLSVSASTAAGRDDLLIVTSSNAAENRLLVYDASGTFLEAVSTLGQGGASANAGGVAANEHGVAVVNFGSDTVSVFSRETGGFALRQVVPTTSQPVSVAFGKDHLYVLGTTAVESHRIVDGAVEAAADGIVSLLLADGSAAQVGVAGDQLIVSEKGGAIQFVPLRAGAAHGTAVAVTLPADTRDTPFGLVTRGSNAYVTIAGSDSIALVKNGQFEASASTGTPGGAGQHSPCWIAVAGPYLFSTNSPSRSISRLLAFGDNVVLDSPVAAQTGGIPIDVAARDRVLAVIERTDAGLSQLTQYRIDEDGNLTQTATTPIPVAASGVAIVGAN